MIVDGFDYGREHTQADGPGPDVEIHNDNLGWHRGTIANTKNRPGTTQAQFNVEVRNGHRYRRPMTEAEKQAEKAKEEKVKEERIAIKSLLISEYGNTPSISLSEAVEISGLQCVADEKERQSKEKEIKVGDWFRHNSGAIDRCGEVRHTQFSGLFDFRYNKGNCAKITDPAFIAMLEAGVKL